MQVHPRTPSGPFVTISSAAPAFVAPAVLLAITLATLLRGDRWLHTSGSLLLGTLSAITVLSAIMIARGIDKLHRELHAERVKSAHHLNRFAGVLESTDACVTIVDGNGLIAFQNAGLTALTGRYPWEVTGQAFAEMFGSEHRRGWPDYWLRRRKMARADQARSCSTVTHLVGDISF